LIGSPAKAASLARVLMIARATTGCLNIFIDFPSRVFY
jgi:hypothetical protein